MPICLLETNLTTADVPSDLSVKLSKLLADELKKPIEVGYTSYFVLDV